MSEDVRSFIAIEIPEGIRERIGGLQKRLRESDCQVSWVKPSNIHLTLKFIGQTPRDRIAGISAAIEGACVGLSTFELEIGATGSFPSRRNLKVLWVGINDEPTGSLKTFHARMESELAESGFPRETKSFNPHLTIGRLRSTENSGKLIDQMAEFGFSAERFVVREIVLMRSELNPAGSIYTPLTRIPLQDVI